MRKLIANLSDANEYAIVWAPAQSNGTPCGSQAEGFSEAPHLRLPGAGMDLDDLVIAAGDVGDVETLAVAPTLVAGEWVGAALRLGTVTAPRAGHGTVTANAGGAGTSSITVTWTKPAAIGAVRGYLVRTDGRGAKYDSVRVLTPHQPDQGGAYPGGKPVAPGFTIPASITSYADLGVFLPFSFLEGVNGYGVSETNVGGAVQSATATSLTLAGATLTASVLAGGYLRIDHAGGTSWADIDDNTTSQFTGLVWRGAGTPSGAAAQWQYEAWLPHHANNPAHNLPGRGFRYPSNESQPNVSTRNRPAGVPAASYGDRFGAMIACAWQVSQWLGKRVNVIPLAIDGSSMLRTNTLFGGSPGPVGWWTEMVHCDWTPSAPNGLAERLRRLVQVMAPAALQAEGNPRPLRILGIVGFQGEAEAGSATGRSLYRTLLPEFYAWLRKVIGSAGLSPYGANAKIPVVHASLPHDPWERNYPTLGFFGDTRGLVNAAIAEFAATDGFAGTFDTNASPKLSPDILHFNGVGEARNGMAAATTMATLIARALSMQVPHAIDASDASSSAAGDRA